MTEIKRIIASQRIAPGYENVLRVFSYPISHYRAVIVGQDPYPTPGYATGLAFSVSPEVTKLPASLKNIFTEYVSDTGFDYPLNGDLTSWAKNGVALLNSSLTLNLEDKSEHLKIGWQRITSATLNLLAERGCVAILWGSHAQKLGSIFSDSHKVESCTPAHFQLIAAFLVANRLLNAINCLRLLENYRSIGVCRKRKRATISRGPSLLNSDT